MKISFKIYDLDLIDCSSCYNAVFPKPESIDVLLEILLKICESSVVAAIGQFTFRLNGVEFQSPNIYGVDYKEWERDNSRYEFATGKEAQANKIAGLMVETKEDALKRIKEPTQNGKFSTFKCKYAYYIEPGLEGIKNGINYIKSLYSNQKEDLPDYLQDIILRRFGFSVGVIWGMNEEWYKLKDGSYSYIDYERCGLGGGCDFNGCGFGFQNFGGDSFKIYTEEYYLNHLNAITEILDEIVPGKYIAGPEEMEDFLKAEILKKQGRRFIPVDYDDDFLEKTYDYEMEQLAKEQNLTRKELEEKLQQNFTELKSKIKEGNVDTLKLQAQLFKVQAENIDKMANLEIKQLIEKAKDLNSKAKIEANQLREEAKKLKEKTKLEIEQLKEKVKRLEEKGKFKVR